MPRRGAKDSPYPPLAGISLARVILTHCQEEASEHSEHSMAIATLAMFFLAASPGVFTDLASLNHSAPPFALLFITPSWDAACLTFSMRW